MRVLGNFLQEKSTDTFFKGLCTELKRSKNEMACYVSFFFWKKNHLILTLFKRTYWTFNFSSNSFCSKFAPIPVTGKTKRPLIGLLTSHLLRMTSLFLFHPSLAEEQIWRPMPIFRTNQFHSCVENIGQSSYRMEFRSDGISHETQWDHAITEH